MEVFGCTNLDNKNPVLRGILEPSDGLEPVDPSLPFRCARNYWRPEATDSACLGRFGRCRTCAGSPPFAPALLHKCSTCWAGQLGTNTWCGGDGLDCCSEEPPVGARRFAANAAIAVAASSARDSSTSVAASSRRPAPMR